MIKSASTNWKQGITKPYGGKIRDISNHVRIAYNGTNGKREIVIVSPDRVEIKFNSLLEQGLNPYILK
jgi:hypothetical protein